MLVRQILKCFLFLLFYLYGETLTCSFSSVLLVNWVNRARAFWFFLPLQFVLLPNLDSHRCLKLFLKVFNFIFQVNISSIVKWGYPDNFKPVYFSLEEKISRAQKHVTPRSLWVREKLLSLLFSVAYFVLLADFCLWHVFMRAKSFPQKKKKKKQA